VPATLDHDPFADGPVFNSPVVRGTDLHAALRRAAAAAGDGFVKWPSPIVDESDPVDLYLSTQPGSVSGGTTYFTPDINPPPLESTGGSSTVDQWTPVETTSGISTGAETDINWRWRQLRRRVQRVLSPQTSERTAPMQFATILPDDRPLALTP